MQKHAEHRIAHKLLEEATDLLRRASLYDHGSPAMIELANYKIRKAHDSMQRWLMSQKREATNATNA